MQINKIQSYQNRQTNFMGNRRFVKNNEGKLLYKTTTYYFRNCFDWNNFAKILETKYKDTPKVNFIVHACSCGAEAETVVMLLLSKLKNSAKKFFPIIAKDIDKTNIEMALRQTPMGINDKDIYRINYYTNDNFNTYMTPIRTKDYHYDLAVKANTNIRENIEFSQGDIFEDIDSMPNKNTVLFCRNFWTYLGDKRQNLLAQKLSEKFDDSSLIIIGEHDIVESNAVNYLIKYGFRETNIDGIFTKPDFTKQLRQ